MKKYNILLIDDDDVNTFFVQHKLSSISSVNEILIAENGQDALDKLDAFEADTKALDFIFLDINMPVMNGFEFLEIYQTSYNDIRNASQLYIVSSSNHPSDREKANTFECVKGYIDKDNVIEDITEIIT